MEAAATAEAAEARIKKERILYHRSVVVHILQELEQRLVLLDFLELCLLLPF